MYYFRILACALFVFIVPILLISSSVLLVINAPLIYSYGFERYEIDERTGIEYNELINAAGQIVEYFNNGADGELSVGDFCGVITYQVTCLVP